VLAPAAPPRDVGGIIAARVVSSHAPEVGEEADGIPNKLTIDGYGFDVERCTWRTPAAIGSHGSR